MKIRKECGNLSQRIEEKSTRIEEEPSEKTEKSTQKELNEK